MKIFRPALNSLIVPFLLAMFLFLGFENNVLSADDSDYPNRPITWVIPYGPGGGFDTIARAIAPVMSEYLPRKVPIIIRNIPGGAGRKGVSWVFNSKPDGYTFGYANMPGHFVASLLSKTGYDLSKAKWIGNVSEESNVLFSSAKSGIKSLDDLLKTEKLKFGTGGKGSNEDVVTRLTNEILGLKAYVVTGYRGTNEIIIGMMRGDVHLFTPSASTGYKYVENGDLNAVLILGGSKRSDLYPNTPTALEKGYQALSICKVNRAIFLPPETPEKIIGILSGALTRALKDEQIIKWSKKTGRTVGPAMTSRELNEKMQYALSVYKKYLEILK